MPTLKQWGSDLRRWGDGLSQRLFYLCNPSLRPRQPRPGPPYEDRLAEVMAWIRERPYRAHYVAVRYLYTAEVLAETFPRHDITVMTANQMATGWASVEDDACLSCTFSIKNEDLIHQLRGRLRGRNPQYNIQKGN